MSSITQTFSDVDFTKSSDFITIVDGVAKLTGCPFWDDILYLAHLDQEYDLAPGCGYKFLKNDKDSDRSPLANCYSRSGHTAPVFHADKQHFGNGCCEFAPNASDYYYNFALDRGSYLNKDKDNLQNFTALSIGTWFKITNFTVLTGTGLLATSDRRNEILIRGEVATPANNWFRVGSEIGGGEVYYTKDSAGIYGNTDWRLAIATYETPGNAATVKGYLENNLLFSNVATLSTNFNSLRIGTRRGLQTEVLGAGNYLQEAFFVLKALSESDRAYVWNSGAGRVITQYDTGKPTIYKTEKYESTGVLNWSGFTVAKRGTVKVQVLYDSSWYYHDGDSWAVAPDETYNNTPEEVHANIPAFPVDKGINFKFILETNSDGSEPCEIYMFVLYYEPTAPEDFVIELVDTVSCSIVEEDQFYCVIEEG